jgi:hypothetical protein
MKVNIEPVPISIFHEDGTTRKTLKADLSHQLESEATSRPELEPFDRSHSVIEVCIVSFS